MPRPSGCSAEAEAATTGLVSIAGTWSSLVEQHRTTSGSGHNNQTQTRLFAAVAAADVVLAADLALVVAAGSAALWIVSTASFGVGLVGYSTSRTAVKDTVGPWPTSVASRC